MAKSLAKNSIYTLISNVALAVSNWLVLVIIAKSFAIEQLGAFVLALSLFSPAFLLASFKVRTLLIVDKDWEFLPEHYAASRIFANALAVIAVLMIAKWIYPTIPIWLLLFVALYKMADAWSEFCHSYLRRHQHFEVISVSTATRATLTIGGLLFAIWFDAPFATIVTIWTVSACVFSCLDSWLFFRYWHEPDLRRFSFFRVFTLSAMQKALAIYRRYLTIAVALLISAMFVHMPNFAIAHYLSASDAGIFATISYFLIAGGILINSLSQAATPQLVGHVKSHSEGVFLRTAYKLCAAGLLLAIAGVAVAMVVGEWILTLFYTAEIASFSAVLTWVMVAAGIKYIYIFLGTSLAALKQFNLQTHISLAGFIALCFALVLLIPHSGLLGAAQAMAIAAFVECLLYLFVFRSRTKIAFSESKQQSEGI